MKKIIGATFFLLVVGGLSAFGIYARLPDWETRAQFGDMFGAINALFSTLALVGVVVAVLIQKQELELQRKELEMTRGELERSAQAHESASSSLREQLDLQVTASRLNGLSAMLASIDAEIARHPSEVDLQSVPYENISVKMSKQEARQNLRQLIEHGRMYRRLIAELMASGCDRQLMFI